MNEKMLKTLLEADAVTGVQIVGQGKGFHVIVRTRTKEHLLCRQRGGVRHWASLDAVARWVRNSGMGRAELCLVNWRPDQRPLSLKPASKRETARGPLPATGFLDLR